MKKCKIIAVFLLLLSLSMFAIACSDTEEDPGETGEITITLNTQTLVLEQWTVGKLTATVENGADKTVSWSSSTPAVASVDSEGNVNALEVGTTVITAQVEDASATCNVTVTESSASPLIVASQTEAEPAIGNSVSVTAALYYKGEAQDAVLSWVSGDNAIATVENGIITGVGIGKTTVTVSADFHGEKVSLNISVDVKETASIGLDKSAVELFASDPSGNGDYKTSEPITATVVENNATVSDPSITWKSSNENVAVYDDGSILAKGRGTATVTASWTSSQGTEFTAVVTVTVSIPVVNKTIAAPVEVILTETEKKIGLDKYSLNVSEGVKVYDGTAEVGAVNAGNEVVFTDALTYGEKTVQLRDEKAYYDINIVAITKVITTADELKNLQSFGNPTTNADGIKVYSGYFVLGNDIYLDSDATFTLHYNNNDTAGAAGVTGLNGVFDGRGHMIYGGTYGRGGLLGGVSSGSIVRNVSFINANVTGSGAAAVICEEFGGTMSDVLIDAYLQNGSPVVYIISGNVSMTDVVVYASQAAGLDRAAIAEWIAPGSVLKLENVYLFSDMTKLYRLNQGTVAGEPVQYEYDAKLSDEDVNVTGLDGWNLTMDKAWLGDKPQIIQDMLDSALSDCEVTALAGKTFNLSLEDITVTTDLADNEQSEYITVDGLTISVSEELQSNTNFQYTVTWNWYTSVSKTVTVTVTKSLQVQALETEGLYEQYTSIAGTTPTANTEGLTINLADALSDGDVSFERAAFALINNTVQTALSDVAVSGQSITIPRTALEGLLGEYTLAITVPDTVIYTLPVTIATKLISQTADLQNMPYYGGLTATNVKGAYNGYFVMTQNVNMGETKFSNANWMESNFSEGFQGTFDGRGYSVIGGTYERGGIFLAVGQNGIIKNVAFVGGEILGGWSNYPLVAQGFFGELNNVFIGNVENGTSSLGALLGSEVNARLTNVVLYANKGNHRDCAALAVSLRDTTSAENVYVFSDILKDDGSVKISQVGPTSLDGVHAYTFDQIGQVETSGLTTYWNTDAFDIPVFASSVEYLQSIGFLGNTAA